MHTFFRYLIFKNTQQMSEKQPFNSLDNQLKITIKKDGVHYLVLDSEKKILLRQEINLPTENSGNDIVDFFFNQPELQVFDKNVKITFDNTIYTLFPNELFRKEDYKTLFEIEHKSQENSTYLFHKIEKWELYFVFRISEKIKSFFNEKYPQAKIKHSVSQFLKKRVKKEDGVYVLSQNTITTVAVVKNSELQLTTSFHTPTNEDAIFYILSIYKELELKNEEFPVSIFGTKNKQRELKRLLENQIKEIRTERK